MQAAFVGIAPKACEEAGEEGHWEDGWRRNGLLGHGEHGETEEDTEERSGDGDCLCHRRIDSDQVEPLMKRTTGKVLWAGISHFVVGLCVVDLALAIVLAVVTALFEVHWPVITIAVAMVLTPPVMAARAVRKERARQEKLGLRGVPDVISDPVLGELRRSEIGEEMWETKVPANGANFLIVVDGEGLPDPLLLEKAWEIARDASGFLRSISESKERLVPTDRFFEAHADEIRALVVNSVIFYYAGKPDDVEVYFDGGAEGRCWRGSLSGFRLETLGCET